ncbi:DNA/RNA helicase domain-containing protein [Kitasatospora misakiensis]|uniref:DNA/RNA helicase domain-containing protein n=1 Tax=Kitasatospora misakiensis TaxID=67330 RepID=A0ABW0WY61_9ACTN
MLLLQLPARDLLRLHERGLLVSHLSQRYLLFNRAPASRNEQRAWEASLVALAEDLVGFGLGEVRMFVEYQPPSDGEDGPAHPPIDVLLVGRYPDSDRDSVLVVELKQWSAAVRSPADPAKVDVPGLGAKKHPAQQVRSSYETVLAPFGLLDDLTLQVGGFSYLHNAHDVAVRDLLDAEHATGGTGLYFTADTRHELGRLLLQSFAPGDNSAVAERLLRRIGIRNTPLLEAMVRSRGEDTVFTLRGVQRTVADQVRRDLERMYRDGETGKAVFVVTGGAGTGKSAIGLELHNRLSNELYRVLYATGARAFDANLREHLGMAETRFRKEFKFFRDFVEPPAPRLDVLICDEAHRLRERSTFTGFPGAARRRAGTRPQVEELIEAARITVFLLDEAQSLRNDEVGTRQLIVDAAKRMGAAVRTYDLQDYYRCGGSTLYRQWVWDLLGLEGGQPRPWVPDGLMHVELAETPTDLEKNLLREIEAGASGRMVAGFCWKWSDPREDGSLVTDVRIGGWHKAWNAKPDPERRVKEYENNAPPAELWATRTGGKHQIGCVYSAQGLEWDWCAVIMGEDLVRRGDRWVMQKGSFRKRVDGQGYDVLRPGSADPRIADESGIGFAQRVRHAYHVLLTRASKATVLHSTDPETMEFLRTVVPPVDLHGLRPSGRGEPDPAESRRVRPTRGRGKARRPPVPRGVPAEGQNSLFDELDH